jgi:hypothetical protein
MIVTEERDTVLKDRLCLVSTTVLYHLARQLVDNFTPHDSHGVNTTTSTNESIGNSNEW